jgi:hypothetical protein
MGSDMLQTIKYTEDLTEQKLLKWNAKIREAEMGPTD